MRSLPRGRGLRCFVQLMMILLLVYFFSFMARRHVDNQREFEKFVDYASNRSIPLTSGQRGLTMNDDVHSTTSLNSRTNNISHSSNVTKVLLFAYYRGGSSFLGEMLNNNYQAFYMFEPLIVPFTKLRKLYSDEKLSDLFYYKNGSALQLSKRSIDSLIDPVRHILNCEFDKVNPKILAHPFYTEIAPSNSMRPYRQCVHFAEKRGGTRKDSIRKCTARLTKLCQSKPIRSIKSIRFTAQLTRILLARDPSIKVVHYTRDPRGIMLSRSTLHGRQFKDNREDRFNVSSKMVCNRMRKDITGLAQVKDQRSIHRLRYENLSLNPYETINKLYAFLERRVPVSLLEWIPANTEAATDNHVMGTRRNSTRIVSKWKDQLSDSEKRIIESNCAGVIS